MAAAAQRGFGPPPSPCRNSTSLPPSPLLRQQRQAAMGAQAVPHALTSPARLGQQLQQQLPQQQGQEAFSAVGHLYNAIGVCIYIYLLCINIYLLCIYTYLHCIYVYLLRIYIYLMRIYIYLLCI